MNQTNPVNSFSSDQTAKMDQQLQEQHFVSEATVQISAEFFRAPNQNMEAFLTTSMLKTTPPADPANSYEHEMPGQSIPDLLGIASGSNAAGLNRVVQDPQGSPGEMHGMEATDSANQRMGQIFANTQNHNPSPSNSFPNASPRPADMEVVNSSPNPSPRDVPFSMFRLNPSAYTTLNVSLPMTELGNRPILSLMREQNLHLQSSFPTAQGSSPSNDSEKKDQR